MALRPLVHAWRAHGIWRKLSFCLQNHGVSSVSTGLIEIRFDFGVRDQVGLDLLELGRPLLESGGHKVIGMRTSVELSMSVGPPSDLLTILPLLCSLLSWLKLGIRHVELLLTHLACGGI